jgi:hypothetical protein
MKYQFTHQDEKGDGEQSEGRNRSESSGDCADQTWYPPQEKIGRNHIHNEKGKGNGQVGEKQEHHPPEEQANDQPPFHGLPHRPNINKIKIAPSHPEKLESQEDAPDGDDDENSRFRNSHCPDIRHPACNTFTYMEKSKKSQSSTGKPADGKHDTIEIRPGFFIEMSVYDIGRNMSSLSQKPGRTEEDDPQKGIFAHRYDPYCCLSKNESHKDGVAHRSRYKHQ